MKVRQTLSGVFAVALTTLAGAASAAVITVPPELTDAGASVLVVGAAVFSIAVGIKLYKWIKRAL